MSPDSTSAAVSPVQSRVARNTLLNVLGFAVPLAVAFLVMPVAARHLGAARFGLLGLAWAITEYLTLFDLGLGRATVKFVADGLHGPAEELSEIASLATITQLLAGALGGFLFYVAAGPIVDIAFDLPPEYVGEAVGMFKVVGLSLPVVLLLSALRGILEGAQRFDLSNSIRTIGSSASVIIPAIGAVMGVSLPVILLWVLVTRVLVCGIYAAAIRSALPSLAWRFPARWDLLRKILSFGGWVFVSNAITPLLVYFDRFALAAIAGIAAVGFYTAPYEGLTRLLLLPISLMISLFPALTGLERASDRGRLNELSSASIRTLTVIMALPLAVAVAFAPEFLQVWLGPAYAEKATAAFRILAVGVLMNALAHPLFISLYALNRPDLPAKFHLVELVIHVPLTIMLIRSFGITGAAAAWTARVSLDFLLLIVATSRVTGRSLGGAAGGESTRLAAAVLGLAGLLWWAGIVGRSNLFLATLLSIAAAGAFAAVSWSYILHDVERLALARIVARPFTVIPR